MTEPVDDRSRQAGSMSGPPPPPGFPPPAVQPLGYRLEAPGQRAASPAPAPAAPGFRGRQLVWVSLAVVDLILALNFIFFLAGANDVGFGHVVYGAGGALNAPFRGLFTVSLTHAHPVQWGDVIAVIIYTVGAWIVDRLIVIFTTPSSRPASPRSHEGSPPPPY